MQPYFARPLPCKVLGDGYGEGGQGVREDEGISNDGLAHSGGSEASFSE